MLGDAFELAAPVHTITTPEKMYSWDKRMGGKKENVSPWQGLSHRHGHKQLLSKLLLSEGHSTACHNDALPALVLDLGNLINSSDILDLSNKASLVFVTCSIMAASRPRASPCPSPRVITAEPILITTLLACFSSARVRKGVLRLPLCSTTLPLKIVWLKGPGEMSENRLEMGKY